MTKSNKLLEQLKEKKITQTQVEEYISNRTKEDTVLFSEVCLEFENNWHHEIFYDILDGRLTQCWEKGPNYGKVVFNKKGVENKKVVILSPRGSAKSQCISKNYVTRKIYQNPDIRILEVGKSESIVRKFLRTIRKNLETNERLRSIMGSLVPKSPTKWTNKEIIVDRESSRSDATVSVSGVFGSIVSKRSDLVILDDILDEDNSRTNKQKERIRFWYNNVLDPVMTPDAQLVVVGTAWFMGDLYDEFLNEKSFDIRLKLKALIYDSETGEGTDPEEFPEAMDIRETFSDKVIDEYGISAESKVLWPRVWPYDRLMEKFESDVGGKTSFYRSYLNEPIGEETQLFKDPWVSKVVERGKQYSLIDSYDPEESPFGPLITAVGVDLAISKKKDSDDTAIATWGLTNNGDMVLLNLKKGKWSPDETQSKVLTEHHNFKPYKIRVENVAFQDMMRKRLAETDIPVEGFTTSGANKYSEEIGLNAFAAQFERGKIIIPSKKKPRRKWQLVQELINDLISYPGKHTGDLLMASWFAFNALQEMSNFLSRGRQVFSEEVIMDYLGDSTGSKRYNMVSMNPVVVKENITGPLYIFKKPEKDNQYFIAARKEEEYCFAICLNARSKEVVAKFQGDFAPVEFATRLERFGKYYKTAVLIVDTDEIGEAVLLDLQRRNYPRLACLRPTSDGPSYDVGWETTSENLPLIMDSLTRHLNNRHLILPDKEVIDDISRVISIQKDRLEMNSGRQVRVIPLAIALYLLEENDYNKKRSAKNKKEKSKKQVPYRVFNYSSR